MKRLIIAVTLLAAGIQTTAFADMTVEMRDTKTDKVMGTIMIQSSPYGTLLVPKLAGVLPGLHGFHLHVNGSCADGGKAAGGHFDPGNTNKHLGPYNPNGHLGDLPVLYVNQRGEATTPVLAPRIKPMHFQNRALMIHAGADNYSDYPKPLGGGGARMICGVVKNTASNDKK